MYLPWLMILIASVGPGIAFYHMKSVKTIKATGIKKDALFGFSVSSMAKGSKAQLIVGAPLEDAIGVVFSCEPSTQACSRLNRTGFATFSDVRYKNHSYWFGATVSGTDDFFVACAPLSVTASTKLPESKEGVIQGKCYRYTNTTGSPLQLRSILMMQRIAEHVGTKLKLEDTMDTLGWSLVIDSEGSVLAGGPAMTSGGLMKLMLQSNKVKYATGSQFNSTKFNFGYSVATGKFLSKSKMTVAVGSTYGSDGRGTVEFRPLDKVSDSLKKDLVGPFLGSMYGAALCAATLAGERERGDLLVGAPAFADHDAYNSGAVYVYIASSEGSKPTYVKVVAGGVPNSLFGSAIANLGDLDGDKRDEIAIAAPYFGDTGRVFVYSGADLVTKDGTPPVPLQVIKPASASTRIFGYSLGILHDYDDNGCNELIIGAPGSNEVEILRCIAEITVNLRRLPVSITKSERGDATIPLDVCLDVQFSEKPRKVNAEIQVKMVILHNAASLQEPKDGILTFVIKEKKSSYCQGIKLFMNKTGDYNKEITYRMKATLLNDPLTKDDFNPEDVKLSKKSEVSVASSIWAQECGFKKCQPKLTMHPHFSDKSPYKMGSTPSIGMSILVENKGDLAYDACVHVEVTGTKFMKPPKNCRALESTVMECKPRQNLRNTWNLTEISIDTTSLTSEKTAISVNVSLYDECLDNHRTFEMSEIFQLIADADSISVEGRTDEGVDNLVNLTRRDISALKQFQHVYTISNSGKTNWVNVPIAVVLPKLDIVSAAVYLANMQCDSLSDDKFNCLADAISKDTGIEVNVIFTVVPDTLDAVIGKENLTVHSEITVQLNEYKKHAEVTSELKLIEYKIPMWIIIVASIIGVVVLVIIFFILKQCGFLKRNNKEELQRVRMSVRRQTMMRKSMTARPSISSEDRQKLISELDARNEDQKNKKDRRVVIDAH